MAWPWEDGNYPSQTFNRSDNIKITVTPYENVVINVCVLQVPFQGSLYDYDFTKEEDGSYTTIFNADEAQMDEGSSCWLAVSATYSNPNITIYWDDSNYYSVSVEVVE